MNDETRARLERSIKLYEETGEMGNAAHVPNRIRTQSNRRRNHRRPTHRQIGEGENMSNADRVYRGGKVAFDAYNEDRGGVNYRGDKTPEWDELPEGIRHAWGVAAAAVQSRLIDFLSDLEVEDDEV